MEIRLARHGRHVAIVTIDNQPHGFVTATLSSTH
jgi:hypothetical protein